MRQIINLLKKDFLNSFIMKIPYYWNTKKERKKLLAYPFFGLLIGLYVFFGIKYVINWIEPYDLVGKGNIYLMQSVLAYTMLLVMSIVPMLIGKFYYSNDVSMLLPMPIKKSDILLSKILYSSIGLLTTALFVVMPFMVRYGMFYQKSLGFYITFIIGLIAHTLIVASIFTFIVVAMMSFINRFAKAKNILQILGTILMLVVSFGISYLINANSISGVTDNLIMNISSTVENFMKYIPSMGLLYDGSHGKIISLVILVSISLLLAFIVSRFASGLMVSGILNNQSVAKRRKLGDKERSQAFKTKSSFSAILGKDLNDILKTPVYLTSTLLMGLVIPLAIAIPFVANYKEFKEMLGPTDQLLDMIKKMVSTEELVAIGILLFLVIMLFMSSAATNTAGSSITREGKYIWIQQVLPINASNQVLGRMVGSTIIFLISVIPLTAILAFLLKPDLPLILAYIATFVVVAIFSSALGLCLDIIKPKLDWESPEKAMKANFNVVILTYVTMILAGLVGYLAYRQIFVNNRENLMLFSIIVLLAFLIIGLALTLLAISLYKKKIKTY